MGFNTAEIEDSMTLDEYLIENKEAAYLLRVKGDSMQEAGILPGDLVIVERGREPRTGDIVVVETEAEDYHFAYYPPVSDEPVTIAAVVRSVVRKY